MPAVWVIDRPDRKMKLHPCISCGCGVIFPLRRCVDGVFSPIAPHHPAARREGSREMSDRRYPEPYTPDACSILTAAAYGLPIDDEARERFTEAADVAWMEARQTRYFDVAQGAYLDFIEGREDARATLYHLSDKDVLAVVATHLCEEP